jgi:small subunit ribosomal protein S16
MAVSIRLRRMGRKKQPHYRIVVAESEHPRDGRFVETLGFYKPLTHPARLVLDLDRVDHWIGQGAQPSGTVRSLIVKARKGGDDSVSVGEVDAAAEKAKRSEMLAERRAAEKKAAAAPAAAPAEEELTPVPQDSSDSPAGSSSADETAAEAMAETEPGAVEDAEDAEPNEPRESIVRSSAESEGTVKPKRKPKVSGADGEEGAGEPGAAGAEAAGGEEEA